MRARRLSYAAAVTALVLAACAGDPRTPAPIQRGGAASGSCGASVTVGRGDTMYAIAQRCGTTVADLARENNVRAPFDITPGQTLRMPGPSTYRVRSGDNLYRIALAHGMTTQEIASLNGLRQPYTIYPGQELLVRGEPQQRADTRPTPTPSPPPPAGRPAPPPPPAAPTSVTFAWPLDGQVIARFGEGDLRLDGIRIRARMGEPVRSAAAGEVVYAGNELQGYGELVLVRHADRWVTAYGLNSRIRVAVGDQITAGQHIADAGASGATDEPALHFEIRRGVEPVDPLARLPQR